MKTKKYSENEIALHKFTKIRMDAIKKYIRKKKTSNYARKNHLT
jgi:hypothetical protein